jgi:iron complex transport system substrate-binding protein
MAFLILTIQSSFSGECLTELKKTYPSMEEISPSYAKNFKIYKTNKFTYIKIKKLWIGDNVGKGYFLKSKPNQLNHCKLQKHLKTNVEKIIPLSTTYVAFLEALKLEKKIVGFPKTNYINSKRTRILVKKQKIKNLKFPLNPEELISLKPDLIISYSSSAPEVLGLEKIEKITKKIIYFPEYLEDHPLGRAEWIILLGYLTDHISESKIFFNDVRTKYLKLRKNFEKSEFKRKVLLGKKQDGNWIAPSSNSYLSRLVEDAGGINILKGSKVNNLKFEEVLKKKRLVDFWLPHTAWKNRNDILNEDKKYNLLFSNTNMKVYNSTRKNNANSGFDFWETGLSRPDLILKDLITIFNHKYEKDLVLRWYKKL